MGNIRDHFMHLNQQRGKVEVPEWKTTFYVGPLTHSQVQEITRVRADQGGAYAIVSVCAKAEDGSPAFGDKELQEMREYGCAELINRVADDIDKVHLRFQEAVQGKEA